MAIIHKSRKEELILECLVLILDEVKELTSILLPMEDHTKFQHIDERLMEIRGMLETIVLVHEGEEE